MTSRPSSLPSLPWWAWAVAAILAFLLLGQVVGFVIGVVWAIVWTLFKLAVPVLLVGAVLVWAYFHFFSGNMTR